MMTLKNNRFYSVCVFSYRMLEEFGVNGVRMAKAFCGIIPYFRDLILFAKDKRRGGGAFPFGMPYPCLGDRFDQSGKARGAYFHQDLCVAQKIFNRNPERHLDVGSRVDGFVAHVASFREIEVVDIRPQSGVIKNIRFRQADLMKPLGEELQECCDSLSCLHALEHFGLGRYGDPIRANGFVEGWDNLFQMLRPAGMLYFSVPLGAARIEFNAHRVFSVKQLNKLIGGRYDVVSFSYIDDSGDFHSEVSLAEGDEDNFGCRFGCAVMELRKR